MKKFWIIKGTDEFAEVKEELKAVRKVLNYKAGTPEFEVHIIDDKTRETIEIKKAVPSNEWRYHISKGPDHPRLKE